jgi:hypothetical protein
VVVVADATKERAKELIRLEGDGVRGCRCPARTPMAVRPELTWVPVVHLAADTQLSPEGRRHQQPRLRTVELFSALDVIGLDEQAGGVKEETMAVITIQGLTKRFGQDRSPPSTT